MKSSRPPRRETSRDSLLYRIIDVNNRTLLQIVSITGILLFFIIHRTFLTPDILFFILLLIFLSYGMAIEFIVTFSPFVLLLVSYEALRSFVPFVTTRVQYHLMINADVFIGAGTLPTVRLQEWLYHGHLSWYDYYFGSLYLMHFIVPILTAVLIWRTRPQAYWRFMWTLVVLSYGGFLTYLLMPAAPPWLAANHHLIPPIHRLLNLSLIGMGVESFPNLYAHFSPNAVAAVPSLHAAFPVIVLLFITKHYGWRWGLLTSIYPISMWIGVIYLGEHYVFDIIAGVVYALIAYGVTPYLMRGVSRLIRRYRAAPVVTSDR